MISFGIRFGSGFDKANIVKLMHSLPVETDYDFLVLGSSAGGVACAKEASLAGKKTAIVRCRKFTLAEEEGYDDDIEAIAEILDSESLGTNYSYNFKLDKKEKNFPALSSRSSKSIHNISRGDIKNAEHQSKMKKVRMSRMDLNNELFKRGREGRTLMLRAASMQNSLEQAVNFGWRVRTSIPSLTINWKKMSEVVMDQIMKENWELVTMLAESGVEIIDGQPSFVNNNTIKISLSGSKEYLVTAHLICAAPLSEYILPATIPGALEYGITCDDFMRLNESPGKTLIVGSTPEGLECAGILACFQMPVILVSRSELLRGYDSDMRNLIITDLKSRGVIFLENTFLASLKDAGNNKIAAAFVSVEISEDGLPLSKFEDTFDTVIFAVGSKISLDYLELENVGIELDIFENKILTDKEDRTSVPNIYAVGESVAYHSQSSEVSETVGTLLGKRLFWGATETMDYSMIPQIIVTPTEYAFAGLSEDAAMRRFGYDCIDILEGNFNPLESAALDQPDSCFIKAVIFKPKKQVIGLHIFGSDAGEIIQGFAAAIRLGMTLTQLQTLVGISATKAQGIMKLAERKSIE